MTGANPAVVLAGTEVRVRTGPDRHPYSIMIARPSTPPPPSGFPVIYLLDANATFCSVVESVRMRCHRPATTGIVPSVVVGIGHVTAEPYDRARRRRDFLADAAGEPDALISGGSQEFLDFLVGVRREIERDFPVNPGHRVLMGHSLGGAFVISVMLERTVSFERFVAISPSLWTAWESTLRRLESLDSAQLGGRDVRAFLSVGGFEEALAPWELNIPDAADILRRRQERQMVSRCRELSQRLAQSAGGGIQVVFREFPGEDHASVVHTSMSQGLRTALALNGT